MDSDEALIGRMSRPTRVTGMRTTRLCRSRDEWLELGLEWRRMLEAKGWREQPPSTLQG
jgi:hypothetical protein